MDKPNFKAIVNEPDNYEELQVEINKLRNSYIAQGSSINLINNSDEFLLRFLRSQRFNQDKALTTLNRYHTYFKNWPELVEKVENPLLVKHVFESGCFVVLNGKAIDGSAIYINRPGKLKNFLLSDFVAAMIISFEALLREESNQIYGVTGIMDRNYYTFNVLQQLRPFYAKMYVSLFQGTFPIIFKTINYVNESKLFHAFYALANIFLKSTTKNQIAFHGTDFSTLYEKIDPSVLPPDYGGTGPSMDAAAERWKSIIFVDCNNLSTYV